MIITKEHADIWDKECNEYAKECLDREIAFCNFVNGVSDNEKS